ncbi:hypothetical protein EK904_011086 [Melospiza melodia maxima]|nr:hypothetical protein EK904_011086 [Melospiza melodia maxima]
MQFLHNFEAELHGKEEKTVVAGQKTKCSPDGNWHLKKLCKFAQSSQASPKGLSVLQGAPGSAEAARSR